MASGQIFLFTGENLYDLRAERSRWMREFIAKHGEENLLVCDAKLLSYPSLLSEISIAPFIADRRMVIVDGIPKLEKEQCIALEQSIHPNVILLFTEPKPDKRLTATKQLLEIATVKTFTPLSGVRLTQWVMHLAQDADSSISQDTAHYLISRTGEDQETPCK